MSEFARTIMEHKYSMDLPGGGKESWRDIAKRMRIVLEAVRAPKSLIDQAEEYIALRKFIPGGRYLYATGRPFHQVQNCLLLRADDSREGWSELLNKIGMALMTGAGIGVDYSQIRKEGSIIRKTGGFATGPLALMQMVNECGRGIMQGGSRRSAIWAGLKWSHGDIMKFVAMKNWIKEVRALKEKDFNFPATLDGTNISVQLDDDFFNAYEDEMHPRHSLAHAVYWATVEQMLKTGEPGFSIDRGANRYETLRNACTEITSEDDSDICNLGSVNMARIESYAEMKAVVEVATAFLLAGTVYSDVPYAKVDMIRTKNRRLGLGLMGLHEWLMMHGHNYGPCGDLDNYLHIYTNSTYYASEYAKLWDLSEPIKTRAIAPTGTIGIVGETTTGMEPMLAAAYKRRFLKGNSWNYQYVIDPTAKRMVDKFGIKPEDLEDAYTLAEEPERRLAFQVHLQQYVDHGISSTLNLPQWGSEQNNKDTMQRFGKTLYPHLKGLRGMTVYPDGARGGQPLTALRYATAMKHVGETFIESADICDITKGGGCGS
jgi:ribonucleoside-diphosphate reductase alpha chain